MAYYGNLALRPERAPQQQPQQPQRQQPNHGKKIRKAQIPVAEKLLYLFTIAVVVAVAGLIIFRYAGIYQITGQIQETNRAVERQNEQAKELQREVERLKDPKLINEKALANGYVPQDADAITVSPEDGQDAVAMKP